MKVPKQINNMTQIKAQKISSHECCMCGDYGFSNELFQCKVCQFRSQHRYCSNLYPNVAETQRICNWCLSQRDDAKEKSQNSSNSSSSFKNDAVSHDDDDTAKRSALRRQSAEAAARSGRIAGRPILRRQGSSSARRLGPIKKQRPAEAPPPKRIGSAAGAAAEEAAERLRRTRSEDIAKVGIVKQVFFRNRVRRYKLLDEVSS